MSEQTSKDNGTKEQLQSLAPEVDSAQSPSESKIEQQSLPKKILKQVVTQSKNVICLIVWTWLVYRIIGKPFPIISPTEFLNYASSIYISPGVSISIQVALVIAVLAIIVFKLYGKVAKFIIFFLLRLIFFPLIFIFYVFYIPYKATNWLYKGVNVVLGGLIRTTILKAVVLLLFLLISAFLIINNSESLLWLVISLIMIMLVIIINLRVAFLWTSKPLIIMEQLLDTYFRFIDFLIKTDTNSIKPKETLEANQKEFERFKDKLAPIYSSLDWSENYVERNTEQRITVKFFMLLLATCFFITVISYGLGYYGLDKVHPNSFTDSASWIWLDYIYSSLLVITTSGELHPLWGGAKIAVALEIISGICLLSLVVFQFSMIAIPEVVDKRSIILDRIKAKKRSITVLEEVTHQILVKESKDVIDINPEDVEDKK